MSDFRLRTVLHYCSRGVAKQQCFSVQTISDAGKKAVIQGTNCVCTGERSTLAWSWNRNSCCFVKTSPTTFFVKLIKF